MIVPGHSTNDGRHTWNNHGGRGAYRRGGSLVGHDILALFSSSPPAVLASDRPAPPALSAVRPPEARDATAALPAVRSSCRTI
jgi:hypothetical protein